MGDCRCEFKLNTIDSPLTITNKKYLKHNSSSGFFLSISPYRRSEWRLGSWRNARACRNGYFCSFHLHEKNPSEITKANITHFFPLFQICQHDHRCYFLLPYHPPEICRSVLFWTWSTKNLLITIPVKHDLWGRWPSGYQHTGTISHLVLLWICSFL